MHFISTCLVWIHVMTYACSGIRLSGCAFNGIVEVSEMTRNYSLTCNEFDATDSVSWQIESNIGSTFPAGTCPCCTCTDTLPGLPVSRTSGTVSQLTVMSPRTWDGYMFTCFITRTPSSKASCRIYSVYPADVTRCSVQANSGSWTINGSCDISKVFSSNNNYSCAWYRGNNQTSQHYTLITTTTYTPVSHIDANYQQGTCSFIIDFDLPSTTNSYYFKAVVYPGGTERIFGPLVIETPTRPKMTCTPSPYVPENTKVSCTCTTDSLGKPSGHLRWSRGSNNQFTVLSNGDYDVTSLAFTPLLLTASDHNDTLLRCDVVWSNDIISGDIYTANVSIGPTQPQFTLNAGTSFLTVNESERVIFECRTNGRPTPLITLTKGNTGQIASNVSPLTYTLPTSGCEDTGNYTYTASNGVGAIVSSTLLLFVNCKPRNTSGVITPVKLPPMLYKGQPVHQSFDLIAYPAPSLFSFVYLGNGKTETAVRTDILNIVPVISCVPSQVLYVCTCTLTVDILTTPLAAMGFYMVKAGNPYGQMELTFQVLDGESGSACSSEVSEKVAVAFAQGLGIGFGVMLAANAIAGVLITVYVWRRQWTLPCAGKKTEISNAMTPDPKELDETQSPIGLSSENISASYDALRGSDIGVRSPYAELRQYETVQDVVRPRQGIKGANKRMSGPKHVYGNTINKPV